MNSEGVKRIVLSGLAGSGKSTVGKILQLKLGWKFISMGDFSRAYARDKFGMDITSFQDYCKQNSNVDEMLDREFIGLCNESQNLIIDYRLGFHFIQDSFTVFLQVSQEEVRRRMTLSGRPGETFENIIDRDLKMVNRLKTKYGIDFSDPRNYALVIETDALIPEEIAHVIIDSLKLEIR